MTVADDNAKLIINKDQFEKSASTLRGLHRYFKSADVLLDAVNLLWQPGMSLDQLLDKQVPEGFTKKYNLGKDTTRYDHKAKRQVNKRIDATDDQKYAIDQAQKILGKSEEELKAEGRMVESPLLGKCLVFINDKRLNAGHDAVKAYFGDNSSYIVFDSKAQSFLVNTHNKNVDLSKVFAGFKQGVPIRGAMFIIATAPREIWRGLSLIYRNSIERSETGNSSSVLL